MMRVERRTHGLIAAALGLLSAEPAAAYCRTTTQRDAAFVDGCPAQGIPVYWRSQCLGYRLYQDAAAPIPVAELAPLVARAFAHWTKFDEPCLPSLDVVPLMPTSRGDMGYEPNGPNSNLIVFRTESWPYNPEEFEHTTLTYSLTTGEILDADMEINGADPVYAVGEDALGRIDLETVLTHGAGHFLGFAHSDVPSIMEQTIEPGASPELSSDDAQGVCEVYPEGGERLVLDERGNEVWIPARTCSFIETAGDGTAGECGPLDVADGCSVTRTPLGGAGWSVSALGGLVGAAALRRRRRVRLR